MEDKQDWLGNADVVGTQNICGQQRDGCVAEERNGDKLFDNAESEADRKALP